MQRMIGGVTRPFGASGAPNERNSLRISEPELVYARSAFKVCRKHKSIPGDLREHSLLRGCLALLRLIILRASLRSTKATKRAYLLLEPRRQS